MTCQKADGESMAQKIIGARWPVSWFGSMPRKSPFLPVVIVPSFCKMETSIEISSPLRLKKKKRNLIPGFKKIQRSPYPVGLGIFHDCTIFKKWPSMSNACIVMWCDLARTLPPASFFHLHESAQRSTSRTLTVLVGADPDYLEKPDGWGTPFANQVARVAWLPRCSLQQRCFVTELCNTERELHHIIIIRWHKVCTGLLNPLSIYWSQQCLRLHPPLHIPSRKWLPAFATDPCRKHWTDPPWQTQSNGSALPSDPRWGRLDTAGEDWLQVGGETLSLDCLWDPAKGSALRARHAVRGERSPGYFY